MNWQHGLQLLFAWLFFCCLLAAVIPRLLVRRNRRVGLPAPKPDDRCSISNFKRIHTP